MTAALNKGIQSKKKTGSTILEIGLSIDNNKHEKLFNDLRESH
jgi:hypothetical protein